MSDDLSPVYRDERDTKPVDEIQARIQTHTDERDPDECWPWQGNTDKNGYPRFRMDGQHGSVTRAQAVLHGIDLEADEFVVRTCGNPGCLNPDHLEATRDVNQARDPNSWVKGEDHGQAKLSDEGVRRLRETAAETDATHQEIAELFSVSAVYVGELVRGESRSDAGGPIKGGEE